MSEMLLPELRSCVSVICKRDCEANNKNMKQDLDPSNPTKYTMYLGASNLYGRAMRQPLPDGKVEWMRESNWKDGECPGKPPARKRATLSSATSISRIWILVKIIGSREDSYPSDLYSDRPSARGRIAVESNMLGDVQEDRAAGIM